MDVWAYVDARTRVSMPLSKKAEFFTHKGPQSHKLRVADYESIF